MITHTVKDKNVLNLNERTFYLFCVCVYRENINSLMKIQNIYFDIVLFFIWVWKTKQKKNNDCPNKNILSYCPRNIPNMRLPCDFLLENMFADSIKLKRKRTHAIKGKFHSLKRNSFFRGWGHESYILPCIDNLFYFFIVFY